jgi:V/A-type H+-transporting ATPase subunit I
MSIIKMKRLRSSHAFQREELMRQLQHLGCVEISESSDKLGDPEWAALLTRSDSGALSETKETHALVSPLLPR